MTRLVAAEDSYLIRAGLELLLGTQDDLAGYLRNFVYRLGAAERAGLQRFRDLLAEHDILEYRQTPV